MFFKIFDIDIWCHSSASGLRSLHFTYSVKFPLQVVFCFSIVESGNISSKFDDNLTIDDD